MKHGDWVLTCFMEPKQFDKFDEGSDDDFYTQEGSYHSVVECGRTKISDEYAEFLNRHKFWEKFPVTTDEELTRYESEVRLACEKEGIKFEWI